MGLGYKRSKKHMQWQCNKWKNACLQGSIDALQSQHAKPDLSQLLMSRQHLMFNLEHMENDNGVSFVNSARPCFCKTTSLSQFTTLHCKLQTKK